MIVTIALLAALAGAAQEQRPEQVLPPTIEHSEAAEFEAGGEEHGAEEFDAMHHVLDSDVIELHPFGEIHLPAAGSWQVGPVDFTPTKYVVFLILTSLLLLAVFIPAGQAAKRRRAHESPGKHRHNVVEATVLFFRDQVIMPNVGEGGGKYVPYLTTLFFFILFANLLGLIPWGATATASVSVTGALAIMSLIRIEAAGMRELGPKGYLGTIFFAPPGMNKMASVVMALFMAPVEIIGKLAKPFALAVRLMANMMAGHIVLLSLFGVALAFGSLAIAVGPFIMSVALFFLELFVAFLQAYIFVILTAVFIGLIRHPH